MASLPCVEPVRHIYTCGDASVIRLLGLDFNVIADSDPAPRGTPFAGLMRTLAGV